MLALHIAGASREEIYRDFEASNSGIDVVRADAIKKLEQGGLDPNEFLVSWLPSASSSPPHYYDAVHALTLPLFTSFPSLSSASP